MAKDSSSEFAPPNPRSLRGIDWGSSAIGIDLGGTKIAVGAVDPMGRARGVHRHPTLARRGPARVIRTILDCLGSCWGQRMPSAQGIGIGVAGQLDEHGKVLFAPNLRWENVPLARLVSRATGIPVTAVNDVKAATYGEWKFGAGRGARDMVCIFVGTGVGGGIIEGGALRFGATGAAGELGHLTVRVGGRKCHCPNRGCLEAYVGGWGIAERAQEAARERPRAARAMVQMAGGVDRLTAQTVEEAYYAKDPLARSIMDETVEYLAAGLVSIANGLNPELIVLGGGVMEGFASLFGPIRRQVRRQGLRAAVKDLRIVPAGLGGSSGIVGSATLAMDMVRPR